MRLGDPAGNVLAILRDPPLLEPVRRIEEGVGGFQDRIASPGRPVAAPR